LTAASSSELAATGGPVTGPARAVPLRAVDEAMVGPGPSEVMATKHVTAGDPYLVGHYPGFTIYPGVFVLETACQAVDLLARRTLGATAELAEIGWLRLTGPARPGDVLRLHASCDEIHPDGLRATVRCTVDDAPVAQLVLHFRLVGHVRAR
jgi:3-hydroxyacyl-[acyl-carrier-protein] dehydratase